MASQAAYSKKVKVGSDALNCSSATLNRGAELLDDTEMANNAGYRTHITGLRGWSINASGPYDQANAAMAAIEAAWVSGAAVTVSYLFDGTNGYTGSATVETVNISGDVAGLETFECTLQSAGALSATP